jgi:hypothetical protein
MHVKACKQILSLCLRLDVAMYIIPVGGTCTELSWTASSPVLPVESVDTGTDSTGRTGLDSEGRFVKGRWPCVCVWGWGSIFHYTIKLCVYNTYAELILFGYNS